MLSDLDAASKSFAIFSKPSSFAFFEYASYLALAVVSPVKPSLRFFINFCLSASGTVACC
jgi:hypothetical protein